MTSLAGAARRLPASVRVAALLGVAYVVAFLHGRLSHTRTRCSACTSATLDDRKVREHGSG